LVTITGTNFKKVKTVKFGSTNATSFAVNSTTSITAVSPPQAAAVRIDVTVTTGKGTSPTSENDHFEATPIITGVSPNEGSPAGGPTVTVTGSGFVVGGAVTGLIFGGVEAEGVFCPTTTECTVNLPPHFPGPPAAVEVFAEVNGAVSPESPAAQFRYRGFVLVGQRTTTYRGGAFPLAVGEGFTLRGSLGAEEVNECNAFVGTSIVSNSETTIDLGVGPEHFTGCIEEQWPGAFSVTVHLDENGSATIEGPMFVRTGNRCLYEGHRLDGGFALNVPLSIGLGGTFTLVAEEVPGAECPATKPVSMSLVVEQGAIPFAEVVS
jgi:hypothetical protein